LIIDESQLFLQNPEITTETGRAVKTGQNDVAFDARIFFWTDTAKMGLYHSRDKKD